MSVKVKIVIGFIIILLMVLLQSILIIDMNDKKDMLSKQILSLFQLNTTMKDKVIDVRSLQADALNKIVDKAVILGDKEQQPITSCVIYMKSLEEWYGAFVLSAEYKQLDAPRKAIIEDVKGHLEDLRASLNSIRATDPKDQTKRMELYNASMVPVVNRFFNSAKDFIGLNSLFFSNTNQNMLQYSERIKLNQFLLIGFALLLIIFVIFYSQRLLQPLNWLMDGVNHITRGDLNFTVRKRHNDELGRLADQFNTMSGEIRNHREHLEELVAHRTEQLLEAKEELEKINDNLRVTNKNLEDARRIMDLDMKMAVNVQSSLFMKKPPQSDEWDISFYFKPMSGVSGDMYDFYLDHEGKLLGLALMDVSGHGIASGLITMIAKSISARVFLSDYKNKLNGTLEKINDELISELGNIDNYLTGILLKFRGDMIEYVNAGHTELLVRRSDLGQTSIIHPADNSNYKGLFLGLEAMKAPFGLLTFKMKKGDTLLVFSDCLNESTNSAGEEYGIDRIVDSMNRAPQGESKAILGHIINEMYSFIGTDTLDDDLSAICIKRKI